MSEAEKIRLRPCTLLNHIALRDDMVLLREENDRLRALLEARVRAVLDLVESESRISAALSASIKSERALSALIDQAEWISGWRPGAKSPETLCPWCLVNADWAGPVGAYVPPHRHDCPAAILLNWKRAES